MNTTAMMNISLPMGLKDFVEEQVDSGRYGSNSEYIRELIRRDQEKCKFCALVDEGLNSPDTGEADEDYFEQLRRTVKQSSKGAKKARKT